MKKIALFIKPDVKSEEYARKFCDISGVDFFDSATAEGVKPDVVVCFGGDGTILRAVPYAVKNDATVISVNTGALGYLSSFGTDDRELFCKTLLQDNIDYDEINLFSVKSSGCAEDLLFLNDVVIQRKTCENFPSCAVSVRVFVDDKLCQSFNADGVIVSSPIGSTAYSWSAGGAVLAPDVSAVIITPICAHSNARPIVISDKCKIGIELGEKSHDCVVCADGKYAFALHGKERIVIGLAEKKLKLLRGNTDYYTRLNMKLLKWGNDNV